MHYSIISSFIYDTFSIELNDIWGSTKFANEIDDLCYQKGLAIFIRDNEKAAYDRRELLFNYLSPLCSTDNPEDTLIKARKTLPTDNLYVKRTLRNICTIYDTKPTLTSEKDITNLVNVIDNSNVWSVLKQSYEVVKLTNEVALMPLIVNGKLHLQMFTNDLYRTVYDDNELTEFWLAYPQTVTDIGNTGAIKAITWGYKVWTNTEYKELDYKLNPVNSVEHGITINGVPTIPVQIRNLTEKHIYNLEITGGALFELVRAQLDCNALEHMAFQNAIYNSFGIWFAQDLQLENDNIKFGNGKVILANKNNEFEEPFLQFISPDIKYDSLRVYKAERVREALKNLGLPTSILDDNPGIASSGVAMQVDRIELDEIRYSDVMALNPQDNDLIRLIVGVLNNDTASTLKGSFQGLYDVAVSYNIESDFIEPNALIEQTTALFDKGLITVQEYVYKLTNKIMSEQECIDYINNNLKVKNELSRGYESTASTSGSDSEEQAISRAAGFAGVADTSNNATIE